jgi:hypothetical protein
MLPFSFHMALIFGIKILYSSKNLYIPAVLL